MTAIITDSRERTRFIKFMVVGGFGFIVDAGTFNLLIGLLQMRPIIAQAISFTLAVISNFIWNRYWTYPDSRTKPISQQLGQFFGVNVAGFVIRTVIFALIEQPLVRLFQSHPPVSFFPPDRLGHNMALATVVLIVLFWNFFVNRYWTYSDVDTGNAARTGKDAAPSNVVEDGKSSQSDRSSESTNLPVAGYNKRTNDGE